MLNTFIKEACVETIEEAKVAQKLGANRIEFCAQLNVGGTTPDFKLVQNLLDQIYIPIVVIIRPRGGDFEYSDDEFEQMKESIISFKELNISGFVFGINKGKEIDVQRTKILAELAHPLDACFHKAIDEVNDLVEAVKAINDIPQINRVLTSGGAKTALEGASTLSHMIDAARPSLSIMPGGKVKGSNINQLHAMLNAKEYHGRGIMMDF